MISEVGITATRRGGTSDQLRVLRSVLSLIRPIDFHHGDCVGGDVEGAQLARDLCGSWIVGHPPTDPKYRAFFDSDFTFPEKPYLVRDLDVVEASGLMLAMPHQPKEVVRSGTWATVRIARQLQRPTLIIRPDGSTREERWDIVKTLYDL